MQARAKGEIHPKQVLSRAGCWALEANQCLAV